MLHFNDEVSSTFTEVDLRDGRSIIFFTPRRLRLRKVLLHIRSSSANYRNNQIRPRLDFAKLQILQKQIGFLLEGSA